MAFGHRGRLWIALLVLILIGLAAGLTRCARSPADTAVKSTDGASPTSSSQRPIREEPAGSCILPPTAMTQASIAAKKMDLLLLSPIVFYGKVVDELGSPVAGAKASASFANTWSEGKFDTKASTLSDHQGFFQFSGHGLGIVVQVAKEGYYQIEKSSGSFGYSKTIGRIEPHPSASDAAIFVLQKMGKPIPLIEWERFFPMPADGSPVDVDLKKGKVTQTGQGDLRVSAWVDDSKFDPRHNIAHYSWRFTLHAPAGLYVRESDFAFVAPGTAANSEDEVSMSATSKSWSPDAVREYFTKTKDGLYVRLKINLVAANGHFFHIEGYVNPNPNDPNLEPDRAHPLPAPY